MGKKDSKKKSADKKARVAEKTARKTSKKEKKSSGKKGPDVDENDMDLDSVLEEYARQVFIPSFRPRRARREREKVLNGE